LAKVLDKTTVNIIIVIITVILSVFMNVNPVYLILIAAVYGVYINRNHHIDNYKNTKEEN